MNKIDRDRARNYKKSKAFDHIAYENKKEEYQNNYKEFVRQRVYECLESGKLNSWEVNFLKSIELACEQYGNLSTKQFLHLDKIYLKSLKKITRRSLPAAKG